MNSKMKGRNLKNRRGFYWQAWGTDFPLNRKMTRLAWTAADAQHGHAIPAKGFRAYILEA